MEECVLYITSANDLNNMNIDPISVRRFFLFQMFYGLILLLPNFTLKDSIKCGNGSFLVRFFGNSLSILTLLLICVSAKSMQEESWTKYDEAQEDWDNVQEIVPSFGKSDPRGATESPSAIGIRERAGPPGQSEAVRLDEVLQDFQNQDLTNQLAQVEVGRIFISFLEISCVLGLSDIGAKCDFEI